MNAVMYVDGSATNASNTIHYGYGVVLLHNGQQLERSIGKTEKRGCNKQQTHEYYAFAHGLLMAKEAGVDLSNMTVFCDDELFGHANFWLHAGNFSSRREAVLKAVGYLSDLGSDATKMLVEYLQFGRIVKLNGHAGDVYQERVDYLAKCGASGATTLPYDEWLQFGFRRYDHTLTAMVDWYPPFVKGKKREAFTSKDSPLVLSCSDV